MQYKRSSGAHDASDDDERPDEQKRGFVTGKRRAGQSRAGRTAVIIVVCLLVVAAIGTGTFLILRNSGSKDQAGSGSATTTSTSARPTVPDPPIAAPKLVLAPLANSSKAPTAAGVAKALAPILADPTMATYAGEVVDPATSAVLWKKDPGSAQVPASSAKLLTGAALLTSLKDPNKRLVTKVVKGDQAGDVYFVGGGDVTLSARQIGTATVNEGAPTVADLAAQVKASGVPVKRIVLDTSYWTGPELATGWQSSDIQGTPQDRHGYITQMQALMVDGDRTDPSTENSPRTGTPAMTAGKALARALGNANLPIITGTAPANAKILAEVKSQPLSILLGQALLNSDNILAESLAREVAGAQGAPRSFDGASAATMLALQDMKLDTINVNLKDGSGMSVNDTVTPDIEAQILSQAVSGKKPALRYLLTGLPVAGVSGTLNSDPTGEDRFNDARSKAGAGWVRAKTGSLGSTYVLSGYTPDLDGRMLVFSLFNNASISGKTRHTQDAFATVLRQCGCQG